MAEVPEGPPRHFTWRRVRHRVVKAEGPERLAPEWWKVFGSPLTPASRVRGGAKVSDLRSDTVCGRLAAGEQRTPSGVRDYYRIEDETGACFWVFREGLYQDAADDGPPAWFLHGLFG